MFDEKFWTNFARRVRGFLKFYAPNIGARFAIVYPNEVTIQHYVPIGGGLEWGYIGIANVGAVPFDPRTLEVASVAVGTNDLPGPASVGAGWDHEVYPFLLNPGEITIDEFHSADTIILLVPEINPASFRQPLVAQQHFPLRTWFSNKSQEPFVNRWADINYTVKLGGSSASFTIRLTIGDKPLEVQYMSSDETTMRAVYAT